VTAQTPDAVWIEGERYDLCEIHGAGLFDPADHDIATEARDSACWRGFLCGYSITDGRLVLDDLELWSEPSGWAHTRSQCERIFTDRVSFDEDIRRAGAMGLAHPVSFTGSLLVGREFIEHHYIHMGLQKAHAYRKVLELVFEDGKLIGTTDRSDEMAEIRSRETRELP
jgi:hypothetical protein